MSRRTPLGTYKWLQWAEDFDIYDKPGNREVMDTLVERAVLQDVTELVWYLDRPHSLMSQDVKADLKKLVAADREERCEKALAEGDGYCERFKGATEKPMYYCPEYEDEGKWFKSWTEAAEHWGQIMYEEDYDGQYEYQLVTPSLGFDLMACGEMVVTILGLTVWARKESAEMRDDPALQNVAAKRKILVGQDNHGNELFFL